MLALGSALDWTAIIVAGIAAIPGTIAAIFARSVRQQIQTPSEESIGVVAEKAHHLASANYALLDIVRSEAAEMKTAVNDGNEEVKGAVHNAKDEVISTVKNGHT